MNELKKFYTKWLRATTIAIGFLCAWIGSQFPDLAQVLVSGVTLGLLFVGAEWFIREKMWRWPFLHRSLNFEGRWHCVTFYDHVETSDLDKGKALTPDPVRYDAVIEQDTGYIRIRPSQGSELKGWESLMMDASTDGIKNAYSVEYAASSELKGKRKGYEELKVQQWEPPTDTKSGLPILLVGTFAHLAQEQHEAICGTAVFCRSTFIDKIKTEGATADHIKKAIDAIREVNTTS